MFTVQFAKCNSIKQIDLAKYCTISCIGSTQANCKKKAI